jgi:hypothetical protein
MALSCCRTTKKHTNQPKTCQPKGLRIGDDLQLEGESGGGAIRSFGSDRVRRIDKMKWKLWKRCLLHNFILSLFKESMKTFSQQPQPIHHKEFAGGKQLFHSHAIEDHRANGSTMVVFYFGGGAKSL